MQTGYRILFWCLLFMGSQIGFAQNTGWEVREVAFQSQSVLSLPKLERSLIQSQDSMEAVLLLDKWCQQQAERGFLECSFQNLSLVNGLLLLDLMQGPYYRLASLTLTDLPESFYQKADFDRLQGKRKPLQWEAIQQSLVNCVRLYQDEGYPFAAFTNLSVDYEQEGPDTMAAHVAYTFETGPFIKVDSIFIKGNPREKATFIHALTRYYPGEPFNQKRLDEIPRILNNSIYYQNVKQPEVSFTAYQTAHINLSLEKKKAGKFDLLLGILPPSNPQDPDQRLQFTGNVDLLLVSPLRFGEVIQLKFDKLTSTSQQTDIQLMLPYLFRTPLRIEGSFNLLKQEEDFLNLNAHAAGRYEFSPFLSAKFYYRVRDTRLIGASLADTSLVSISQLDGNRQLFGVGFRYENLDYRYNPSKGWDNELEIGLGRKTVRQNPNLRPELYEGVINDQATQEVDIRLKWYYSLFPRQVIHLANHTYWIGIDQPLRNDQLQVGGAKSIRGFNENSFFTDFYSFFTAEYRFQLERNSYLFGFVDYAWLRNSTIDQVLNPLGIGLGMNYGTKAGIVSISYAVGQVEGIAFQPARGRIHIGIINQF